MQLPDPPMTLSPIGTTVFVRTAGPPAPVFDLLRRTSSQMSSQQVIFAPQTMEEIISSSLAARRFSLILLGLFAALALVLSTVGIYGVISYLLRHPPQQTVIRP